MKGIAVSPGIVIGKVFKKIDTKIEIKKYRIDNIKDEIERFNNALETTKKQLLELYNTTLNNIGENEAMIFDAHIMILEDAEFINAVYENIELEGFNAEWALKQVADKYIEIFDSMDNEYLRERSVDIKDVTNRMTKVLLGIAYTDLSKLDEKVVIVAEDLVPSDTAKINRDMVHGIITELGGKTSHLVIMARSLEIPAVVGVKGIFSKVQNGDMVVFDGDKGEIYVRPDEDIIKEYQKKQEDYLRFKEKLKYLIGKNSTTKDGYKIDIFANIANPSDLEDVLKKDVHGIGLFRTEFIYMDKNRFPTEEEQFEVYKSVAEKMGDKPVIIRTLDIGGDKRLSYINIPKEENPFLGYRAVRICLDRPEIFKPQLRAIMRASIYGNLKIMFPMISSVEEVMKSKTLLDEVKKELKEKNIDFNENIEIGIMIEVPTAAIISDILAKEVNFFSIGTNDLIQYLTAVDRGNQIIEGLYNQFHPAVLRTIKMVVENAHREGIKVGMCGEAAGDSKMIPLLIGMGLDELSMSSTRILKAKWIIKDLEKNKMEDLVFNTINCSTVKEVENLLL